MKGGFMHTISYTFTREDTKSVKGMAILLMLAHHLWAFPERLASEFQLTSFTPYGLKIAEYIGGYGKICVSLFMFLGGVGVWLQYEQQKLNWFEKIRQLYISYWKVFFLFVPAGFLFFRGEADYCEDTVICHVFDQFHLSDFFAELAGIRAGYNREWWFFGSYIFALAMFPVIVRLIRRNSFGINLWIVCIYQMLVTYVFPNLRAEQYFPALGGSWLYNVLICQNAPWPACFWCGCVFAKDHMLERFRQKLDEAGLLNPAAALAALAVLFILRTFVIGQELDIFYVPVFCIYSTCFLSGADIVKKYILKLGKKSTNMWLLHSFFIYYFYKAAKLVLSVRNVFLVFLLLVAVTYLASCAVDRFYCLLYKGYCRLKIKGKS